MVPWRFATGMAAITATFLTLLKAGDHIVVSQFLFGNTSSLLGTLEDFGIQVSKVDCSLAVNVESKIKENTRMVFVESVANPGTQVPDLQGIGDLCEANGLVYVVDNTILSAYLFKPKSG